ncbi:MAG: aminopeptidase [Treponema sp.]|nr:aminopeptidase [Treponema sp.]
MTNSFSQDLGKSAGIVAREVCGIKKGERVLIVSNPLKETEAIAQSLFKAVGECGGVPIIVFQQEKTLLDYADPIVIAALKSNPDVFLSISANKLGKDEEAMKKPYIADDGKTYNHIFDYLLYGAKEMRAVWTPGITQDMFSRTVKIDYDLLSKRCTALMKVLHGADYVHVTAPAGTDVKVIIKGRKPFADDGNFTEAGSGGNIPAGEVFISPVVGGTEGKIVFDGSMSLNSEDILIQEPIIVDVVDGYVTNIVSSSKKPATFSSNDAGKLLDTITAAEEKALQMEAEGKLPKGMGEVYKKNARHIGELGIGLNPAAQVKGNMLEDEKAFRTCHFAIGSNYDGDADTLIHLDGVVLNPTITVYYADGRNVVIEKNGILQ